ncbi:MAG: DEAD/DEAH box helicase [Planctomycetota bacterium]|jgi:superfamily II DNA or RNA helicase
MTISGGGSAASVSERSRAKRTQRLRRKRASGRLGELRELAFASYDWGDINGALALARQALDLKPRDDGALRIVYGSAIRLRKLDVIGEHVDALRVLDPEPDGAFRLNVGSALYSQRRFTEARRELETFMAGNSRVRPWRAQAKRLLASIEDFERVASRTRGVDALPQAPAEPERPRAARSPRGPRHHPRVTVSFRKITPPAFGDAPHDPEGVALRALVEQARLARGFEELLCLRSARGVDHYWYQIETAKRAIRRFRGRALLADEVGLGKTVEAAMVAAEYHIRGLARRILVLVPPSLVGQWREELGEKFGLDFEDASERAGDADFWTSAERVVSSIALARGAKHFERVTKREWDLVVVDEAHRLKNRRTRGWELVNSLRPKFLLMLSATPVQNDLVELYNIVTLLRPGTLGTEAEFKRRFVKKGEAKDIGALRELLSTVMIRNTRSLIDAKLPARYAETFVVEPAAEERSALARAQALAKSLASEGDRGARMSAGQLLLQAGSSPAALAAALARRGEDAPGLAPLGAGAKGAKLVEILAAKPGEKVIVFVEFTRTLEALSELFAREGVGHAVFSGSMTPAEKDGAIERFRDDARVLLATGSGGEGRNLQFARTVVNFDLPWNPMRIEQRIGRVHRIGQTRDVFVFNLALAGSIEERLLDVLDRKINMFEMVVGEVDDILGDVRGDFGEFVFDLWLGSAGEDALERGFDDLARRLVESRERLRGAKRLGERLFGEDFGS